MTVSKQLIQNIEELRKSLNEISVYDFDVYTSMELYYKIANKLNEVIKELMRFEGLVSDEVVKQNEKLIYLLGEGLFTEVVNKINLMIADGTFNTIINADIFSNLRTEIDVERKRIDNIVSVSSSTDGNAELLDLRVGNDGVVYETAGSSIRTQLDTISKVANKSTNDLQRLNYINPNNLKIDRGVTSTIGEPYELTYKEGWIVYDLELCEENDYFKCNVPWTGIAFFSNDLKLVKRSVFETTTTKIVAPAKSKYFAIFRENKNLENICVSKNREVETTFNDYNVFGIKTKQSEINKENISDISLHTKSLDKELKNIKNNLFDKVYEDVIPTIETFNDGFFNPVTNGISDNTSYKYFEMECFPFEEYKITGKNCWNGRIVTILKDDKVIDYFPKENDDNVYSFNITIPYDANKLIFNMYKNYAGYKLEKVTVKPKDSNDIIWTAMGDSLTAKSTLSSQTETKNYVEFVTDKLNITSHNMGVGGTGYMKESYSNANDQFYNRTSKIDINTDIVTIFGSFNDYELFKNNIGNINDNNTSTFCGCFNTLIKNIISICPNAIIGVITPTPWGYHSNWNSDSNVVELSNKYVDTIKLLCKKWSLPVLDLFNESNMRPWDNEFCKEYMRGDSVHPLSKAHEKFIAPKVADFINKLI